MKKAYLFLSAIGFLAPNYFVFQESIESGNIMLWKDIPATFQAMFGNNIVSAFSIDLLLVVLVFMIWSYSVSIKRGMNIPWLIWTLTMVLGLSGAFPLFLYQLEKAKDLKTL